MVERGGGPTELETEGINTYWWHGNSGELEERGGGLRREGGF